MTELGEAIHRLRGEGKSYRQIQEELSCSKGTIAYYLGAGQKEKNVTRTRDKRNSLRKHVQKIKQETPCADCGENYPYWIMDFDHLYDKKFNISNLNGAVGSLAVLMSEIDKCELVCSNCHRNRTHLRLIKDASDAPDISEWYN